MDNAHWDRSKPSYCLGVQLKSVESFKDLGITINYDLSWGEHVSYIVNKAKKSIFEVAMVLAVLGVHGKVLINI